MSDQEQHLSEEKKTLAATLLSEYTEANSEVEKIKSQLDAANKVRSEKAKNLYTALGKVPYSYKGNQLGKIVVRGDTHFFRGNRDDQTVKVE